MAQYSKQLKNAVMDFVKDERFFTDDAEYMPVLVALPKKEFTSEYKNYKTDWVDEDDFLGRLFTCPSDMFYLYYFVDFIKKQ